MNELFAQLNDFSFNVLLLLATILIKALLSRYIQTEPLRFFSWYNQLLAKKVNKPQNSAQQQNIAGIVASLITLLPIIIILWLFEDFIALPWMWHALLLYLALGNFRLSKTIVDIKQALLAKQTHLAKQTLKPWVLRDVDNLSTMGIAKASIEMQLLRYLQHYFVIAFYFLSVGSLMALTVRLIIDMHYCWNTKQSNFQYFGKFIAHLTIIVQWLPLRVFSLLMLISTLTYNFTLNATIFKKYCFQFNNNIVMAILAIILNIKLAGVASYEGEKLRRTSFNEQGQQPQNNDIVRANKFIHQLLYFSLTLTILAAVLTMALH